MLAVTSATALRSRSSSGGSDKTVRQESKQLGLPQVERTTFTFSSKRSPFAQHSPGSVVFSPARRGSNELTLPRRQSDTQTTFSKSDSDWIPLRPLQPMDEAGMSLFVSPKAKVVGSGIVTAVFNGRPSAETRHLQPTRLPRLSLVAQHDHATSKHPSFNTPPHLVTPLSDPFLQVPKRDSYFLPMPSPRRHRSPLQPHESYPTPSTLDTPSRLSQSHVNCLSNYSTPKTSPSSQDHTPVPRTLFLVGPKEAPIIPSPDHQSVFLVSETKSRSQTPPKSRTPKTTASLNPKWLPTQPQSSIAVFRDCFGTLTSIENLFPITTHSQNNNQAGSDLSSGSSGAIRGSQTRWTRRWLRRTVRGSRNMGSGSGSSADSSGRRKGSGAGPIFLSTESSPELSTSGDSLDRTRVSRSNASSWGGSPALAAHDPGLSDVDEVVTDTEGNASGEAGQMPMHTSVPPDIAHAAETIGELEKEIPQELIAVAA